MNGSPMPKKKSQEQMSRTKLRSLGIAWGFETLRNYLLPDAFGS